MAAFDAFIASWESKRYYDSSRPWHLVRHYYKGQMLRGWKGPGKGVGLIQASEWLPYSPLAFLSPPFPAYVSGHSTVSSASARTGNAKLCTARLLCGQGHWTEIRAVRSCRSLPGTRHRGVRR